MCSSASAYIIVEDKNEALVYGRKKYCTSQNIRDK